MKGSPTLQLRLDLRGWQGTTKAHLVLEMSVICSLSPSRHHHTPGPIKAQGMEGCWGVYSLSWPNLHVP